jgi:mono/diheme cytochrome c family protein
MKEFRRKSVRGAIAGAAGALALTLGPAAVQAEWVVPESARQVSNPVARTADSVETGQTLYLENCATCHGVGGAGDGPGSRILEAPMPNLANASWAAGRTDGEWFYKVATGKDPMIGYEDFLEEVEMWHLVNYMRALGGEPLFELASVETADAPAIEEHAEEEAVAAPATQDGGESGDGHGARAAHGAPVEFDPRGIANYASTHAKGPLILSLLFSVLMGAVFVGFQRLVPAPAEPEPKADDHGHGH